MPMATATDTEAMIELAGSRGYAPGGAARTCFLHTEKG
jgi:hypothetical protein